MNERKCSFFDPGSRGGEAVNCEGWPPWFPFIHKPGEVTAYFSTNAKLDVIRCVRCGCVLATFVR